MATQSPAAPPYERHGYHGHETKRELESGPWKGGGGGGGVDGVAALATETEMQEGSSTWEAS